LLPVRVFGATFIPAANQAARDTVGWPTYVRQAADVYDRLTPGGAGRDGDPHRQQRRGRRDRRCGATYGPPAVYSGQNELYNLCPPPDSALHAVFALQAPIDWFATAFTLHPRGQAR